jgi:hypothetical protein
MDYQPTTRTLDALLKSISDGELALPEFQRDFVWTPGEVAELVDSIARGWPIGTLLLLQGPQELQTKLIDHAPSPSPNPQLYILDGQQRLTALYHAFRNASEFCYYVDFNRLETDNEEFIRFSKREQFATEFRSTEARAQAGLALIQEVHDGDAFFDWLGLVGDKKAMRFQRLREKSLPGLRADVYRVPLVTLSQSIELPALARIFETLNRTGQTLNSFDLMVAVLYPSGFKLRDRWASARREHPLLRVYDVDGLEILKLVALEVLDAQKTCPPISERRRLRGVRQSDVLALAADSVTPLWDKVVAEYVHALNFMKSELGVLSADFQPSYAMILTMAYWLSRSASPASIKQWYWSAARAQSYAQGANTEVVADCQTRLSPRPALNSPTSFLDQVRRNRILARATAGLISRQARDPLSGQLLSTLTKPRMIDFRVLFDPTRSLSIQSSEVAALCVVNDDDLTPARRRAQNYESAALASQKIPDPSLSVSASLQERSEWIAEMFSVALSENQS